DLWMDTKRHKLKEKTIEGNWRKLELYAFPMIGKIPVSKITAPMAIAALKPVEKTGQLETVKRTAQLMNEVMTYAVNAGLVHSNPLTGIREVFRSPQ
ncbi:integrase, partial [Vibrio anguillarum]|nr:integrase [Vibrio anguillarum]